MEKRRNTLFGAWGENQAAGFLRRQGFVVVDQNYYTPAGEIDIVATKGADHYFIEVKTRQSGDMSFDLAVTTSKRHKLLKTVRAYCYRHALVDRGIVLASLMVIVEREQRAVRFRLAVLY